MHASNISNGLFKILPAVIPSARLVHQASGCNLGRERTANVDPYH